MTAASRAFEPLGQLSSDRSRQAVTSIIKITELIINWNGRWRAMQAAISS